MFASSGDRYDVSYRHQYSNLLVKDQRSLVHLLPPAGPWNCARFCRILLLESPPGQAVELCTLRPDPPRGVSGIGGTHHLRCIYRTGLVRVVARYVPKTLVLSSSGDRSEKSRASSPPARPWNWARFYRIILLESPASAG
jgi:hypothetical protein